MSPRTRYQVDDVEDLPVLWEGDVAVVGGGSAGTAAAVSAARRGARTLLIESGGFLGGIGVRVLDTFYGFYTPGTGERVVGGLAWEVCERLFQTGDAFERPNTYGAGTGVTYEPEALKFVWDELAWGSGTDVLLYGLVTAVVMDGSAVRGLVVETRAGPGLVKAGVTIDATGDAEIAWRAGAALETSIEARRRQPATATFRLGGVTEKPAGTRELHAAMASAAGSGEFDLPRLEGSSHATCLPGVRHTNMTRVAGKDLTDPWELSEAERVGRRQVQEYVRFMRTHVAGYSDSYLLGTSTRIGVRETRRVLGAYVLTRDDVLAATQFDDGIARCGAPVEDHSDGAATKWEYIGGNDNPTGETYTIPYRSLLPVRTDGLLVAGRCLSATHDAHASVRSIGQCMAMGEAAGTAAALSLDESVLPRDIDTQRLQSLLKQKGVLL